MLNKLVEKAYDLIGSVAYFMGRCMADGFDDRMSEIQEGESLDDDGPVRPEDRSN